jgi:hypothetical protein
MVLHGHFKNGVVVFDQPVNIAEGTPAEVTIQTTPHEEGKGEETATLYDRLKPIIGSVKGLPPDGSTRIDEDLYGTRQS